MSPEDKDYWLKFEPARGLPMVGIEASELPEPSNEYVLVNVFGLKPRVMGELIVKQAGPVPSDWAVLA